MVKKLIRSLLIKLKKEIDNAKKHMLIKKKVLIFYSRGGRKELEVEIRKVRGLWHGKKSNV
ncbi:MAG: hypothetical protein QXI39_07260 [Candidatus Bathyarchaeia archaeon]